MTQPASCDPDEILHSLRATALALKHAAMECPHDDCHRWLATAADLVGAASKQWRQRSKEGSAKEGNGATVQKPVQSGDKSDGK